MYRPCRHWELMLELKNCQDQNECTVEWILDWKASARAQSVLRSQYIVFYKIDCSCYFCVRFLFFTHICIIVTNNLIKCLFHVACLPCYIVKIKSIVGLCEKNSHTHQYYYYYYYYIMPHAHIAHIIVLQMSVWVANNAVWFN